MSCRGSEHVQGAFDPRLLAKAAGPGRIRGIALQTWERSRQAPARAGAVLREGTRHRSLHSRERRLVQEALFGLVRTARGLTALLQTDEGLALWLGWLVLSGLDPEDAEAQRPGPWRDLAARYRFAVLEDDYDNEFHYAGLPIWPLAARDEDGMVVYIGTLSKTIAPGLRLGYIVATPQVVRAVVATRIAVDRQGDLATEHALATLFEDGTLPRHLRRLRRVYGLRQQHLVGALRERLGDEIAFDVPAGGLALWVRALHADPEGWETRALAAGVWLEAGRRMHVHRAAIPWLRVGFASLAPEELDRAVDVLARTVRA